MRLYEFVNESYTDDTKSSDVRNLDQNEYLEIGDFKAENDHLASYFKVEDPILKTIIRQYTNASSINAELIKVNGVILDLSKKQSTIYNQLTNLKGTELREEHHVYCGTGIFDPRKVITNNLFRTPTFLSTSLSIRVAIKTSNFRRNEMKSDQDNILHFILPKGFKGGFYIAPFSRDPEELEFLIFPLVEFRYTTTKIITVENIKRYVHSLIPL
jgi:hypothetical protein